MTSPLYFVKYEGLENDFVLVEAAREDEVPPALARAICDRRRGVGADGVLLVLPARAPTASARMHVLNADGSVAEMCGNGLRCVALHVAGAGAGARARGSARAELTVETGAGAKACVVDGGDVTVEMGEVRVDGDVTVEACGAAWPLTRASAGNPHVVTRKEASSVDVEQCGRALSTHPLFPGGANVEFARYGDLAVDLVVYERGVGLTRACGTGACAAVAVGVERGLLPSGEEVSVRLPGGTLFVTLRAGRATMRGPARRVFTGTIA